MDKRQLRILKTLSKEDKELYFVLRDFWQFAPRDHLESLTGLSIEKLARHYRRFKEDLDLPLPNRRASRIAKEHDPAMIDYLQRNYEHKTREELTEETGLPWYQVKTLVQTLRRSGVNIPHRQHRTSGVTCILEDSAIDAPFETLLTYNRQMLVKMILHLRGLLHAE